MRYAYYTLILIPIVIGLFTENYFNSISWLIILVYVILFNTAHDMVKYYQYRDAKSIKINVIYDDVSKTYIGTIDEGKYKNILVQSGTLSGIFKEALISMEVTDKYKSNENNN